MSSHSMKIITAEKDLHMSPKLSYYEHPVDCKVMSVNPLEFGSVVESEDSRLGDPSSTVYFPESTNRTNTDCWDLNGLKDALDSCTASSPGDHNKNPIVTLNSSTEYSPGYVKTSNILMYNPTLINTSNDYSPGFVDSSDIPEYYTTKYNASTEDSHGSLDSSDIPEYSPAFVDTPDIPEYIPTKIKLKTSTEDSPGSLENYNYECIICEFSISTAEYNDNCGICFACSSILSKMKKRRNCHRSCPITSSCSHESYHSNPAKRKCIRSQEPSYA